MRFRDNIERDPESYAYRFLLQKDIDEMMKKRQSDKTYRQSYEIFRELVNQSPKAYIYKLKLKDLAVGEGFYNEDFQYICQRIE